MMRRCCFILLLLMAVFPSAMAQKHASVIGDERCFEMKDLYSGVYKVSRNVLVLDEQGLSEASVLVYTGKDQSLDKFSGSMFSLSGKETKIRKSDLSTVSLAEGLASDGFVTGYVPRGMQYPFTVRYDYEVRYRNGFAVFPTYTPVSKEGCGIKKGSYTIDIPEGTPVRYLATAMSDPVVETEAGRTRMTWTVTDYEGYVQEHDMPAPSGFLPRVICSPEDFVYDNHPGRQASWQELGLWQYGLLKESEDLPAGVVQKARELTAGCASDLEKVRVLYDLLRRKTRYVSIQFGIGGFKPFPASVVDRTGFGDCKALSNYMRCLLDSVGVKSEYAILNTNRRRLSREYPSFGQTNHAMLCVPMGADTLWMECTNPTVPFGYRHGDIAGHDVLLIREDGGHLVTAAPYPDSLDVREKQIDIELRADGSATMHVGLLETLEDYERWIGLREEKPSDQQERLSAVVDVQVQNFALDGIVDNADSYDGNPSWYLKGRIDFHFDARTWCTVSANRLVASVNPSSKRLLFQRGERKNPMSFVGKKVYRDRIRISIPEGYVIEALPATVELDTPWGTFRSECVEESGSAISVLQEFRMKAGFEPAENYPAYRDFARAVNKAYTSRFVLVKK